MKKYSINGRDYWVGCNRKLGLLIYDPQAQLNVERDKVRLFKVRENKLGIFRKEVKSKLVPCTELDVVALEKAANEYAAVRQKQRAANCYSCKRSLDSVSFSICEKCDWIECTCGACGCGYVGV